MVYVKGVYLTMPQLDLVARRFRLNGSAYSLRDVMFGAWDRNRLIVPETAPMYPYIVRSGVGLEVELT